MLKIYARKCAVLQHFFTNHMASIHHNTFQIVFIVFPSIHISILHVDACFAVIGYGHTSPFLEISAHIRRVGEM